MELNFYITVWTFGFEILCFIIVITWLLLRKHKSEQPPSWPVFAVAVLAICSLYLTHSYALLQLRGAQQGWDWIVVFLVALVCPIILFILRSRLISVERGSIR